ncbi:hypothetical protein JYU34_010195 [Plutella xylostella]|uniref:Uncharacterized protein n=1 Tax=Plutella xylostella TaxID=51655 RepID=A0ABQ7QI02_PLUXY|nr:hypothetical protein JYU34_010195 [Plutella xylostella]
MRNSGGVWLEQGRRLLAGAGAATSGWSGGGGCWLEQGWRLLAGAGAAAAGWSRGGGCWLVGVATDT